MGKSTRRQCKVSKIQSNRDVMKRFSNKVYRAVERAESECGGLIEFYHNSLNLHTVDWPQLRPHKVKNWTR